MDLSVPDTVDNRYKVLEVIGTGAMATVYAAEDTRLGRKVALKILRPEQAQDDTFRARFKREAEAVASLNNPAIVAVYDTGSYNPSQDGKESDSSEEGTAIPYIVMEYVEGHTLRSILSRGGHLPVRDALGYSEQLLGACSTATRWASFTAILSRRILWCWSVPARISLRVSRARSRSWISVFPVPLRKLARR